MWVSFYGPATWVNVPEVELIIRKITGLMGGLESESEGGEALTRTAALEQEYEKF